jgi:hypothetical protein
MNSVKISSSTTKNPGGLCSGTLAPRIGLNRIDDRSKANHTSADMIREPGRGHTITLKDSGAQHHILPPLMKIRFYTILTANDDLTHHGFGNWKRTCDQAHHSHPKHPREQLGSCFSTAERSDWSSSADRIQVAIRHDFYGNTY